MTNRFEIIPFNNHQLLTVQDATGTIRVMVKPICESMGLDWDAQRKRIHRHPVLSKGASITTAPSGGGMQEAITLELETFHGWLMTISPDRIKDEAARDVVIAYQEKAFRVVFEYFHGPMRDYKAKRATVSDLLRVGNGLKKERNREIRALLWAEMDRICDSWGQPRLAHQGIGWAEPDQSELLNSFWEGVKSVENAGYMVNHSRRNHLVALHLPQLSEYFFEVGVPVDIDPTMKQALRLCQNPIFVADKGVNSKDGKNRHCWIFSHLPLLEKMEAA
ncbi:MAG: hypothetical protein E2598_06280 [Sphingobium sp.]|nr:hypothetical protein [Sphingobium sp.]